MSGFDPIYSIFGGKAQDRDTWRGVASKDKHWFEKQVKEREELRRKTAKLKLKTEERERKETIAKENKEYIEHLKRLSKKEQEEHIDHLIEKEEIAYAMYSMRCRRQ